eukprot:CAMPEP_0117420158 /NCGR_PEP_ID=MMETSP0758-20121206/1550_1 /TAXON_ID=63605 /ORGANISM="Percolomonas cosmopolitus, Strain AE-1 (ATCC 50343)" /LENGTH=575 /DNA_ID=CAMNT_0005201603 /DNA_START=740 /DNA_END=2463 /DNA_ORIENTATION=+
MTGYNSAGQLGMGHSNSVVGVQIVNAFDPIELYSNSIVTMYLAQNGSIFTAGDCNGDSKLTKGTTNERKSFHLFIENVIFKKIFLTIYNNAGGLDEFDRLWAWGQSDNRNIYNSSMSYVKVEPSIIAYNVSKFAIGREHIVIVKSDGMLYCRGVNYDRQCGWGFIPTMSSNDLLRMNLFPNATVANVFTFMYSTVVHYENGDVYRAGTEYSYETGLINYVEESKSLPFKKMDYPVFDNYFVSLTGYRISYVKSIDSRLYHFGENTNGAITSSYISSVLEPKEVGGVITGIPIDIIYEDTSLIMFSNATKTYFIQGQNTGGRLGDGTTAFRQLMANSNLGDWDGVTEIKNIKCSRNMETCTHLDAKGKLYIHGSTYNHQVPNTFTSSILYKRKFDLSEYDPAYDGAPIIDRALYTNYIVILTSSNILYGSGKPSAGGSEKMGGNIGSLLFTHSGGAGSFYKTDFSQLNMTVIGLSPSYSETLLLTKEGTVYTMYNGGATYLSNIFCTSLCEINVPGYADVKGLISEMVYSSRLLYFNTIDGRSLMYTETTALSLNPSGFQNYWNSLNMSILDATTG